MPGKFFKGKGKNQKKPTPALAEKLEKTQAAGASLSFARELTAVVEEENKKAREKRVEESQKEIERQEQIKQQEEERRMIKAET
eukprot:gene29618-20375_t